MDHHECKNEVSSKTIKVFLIVGGHSGRDSRARPCPPDE